MIKVSVVMATYNGEEYIEKQLLSIINQSRVPDEIIVCDDCSNDNTISIIESISKKMNFPIKLEINKENMGYIKNFTKAISNATGDYIFLCDQDDIWKRDKVKDTINIMKKYDKDVACTGFELINSKDEIITNTTKYKCSPIFGYENWSKDVYDIRLKNIIWGNFNPGCTYCFTKKIKNKYLKINNSEISHDYQILLIGANNKSAIFIDTPYSQYRLHERNVIGMNKKGKSRKRHFQPRVSRFFYQYKEIEKISYLLIINLILYVRLPWIRSKIIHKFNLNNKLNLYKISKNTK